MSSLISTSHGTGKGRIPVWSPDRGVFLVHGRRIGRSRGPLLSPAAHNILIAAAVFALGLTAGGALVWLLGVW